MLKKGFRLRKKEDFDQVFRFGRPLFFEEIGCRYLTNQDVFQIGFSFGKKYLPLAVDRNRLRRVISQAVLECQLLWPKRGKMVFFLSKKPKSRDILSTRPLVKGLFLFLNKK